MIKNVVFDIGNVLAGFVWEQFYRSFGFEEDIFKRLAAVTVQNPFWNEFDRGCLTTEDILNGFINKDPGIEKEIRKVFENVEGMILRFDYAIPWIKELKQQGYKIYVISNFAEKAYHDCRGELDFLEETDGALLSFQDKIIKPSPDIYRLLCSRYKLMAEECVFIDDLNTNVEAARKEGMKGIIFQSYDQARGDLKELLDHESV